MRQSSFSLITRTRQFLAGDRIRTAESRSSPCVPVTIKSDAASRIAAVNATVTSPTGVLIMFFTAMPIIARCRGKDANGKGLGLHGNRHCHGDFDRKHGQRDHEAKRQCADRERGGDGVGQSGRGNWQAAPEAGHAGRPNHGLNPSRRANHPRRTGGNFATLAGNIAAATARKMAKPRQSLRFCPLFCVCPRSSRYSKPRL
jgi:hypothetical protein